MEKKYTRYYETKNSENFKNVPQQISVLQCVWVLQVFLKTEFFQKTYDLFILIEILFFFHMELHCTISWLPASMIY